ncbi:2-C-methyl-D-erythritol 4-phosphate cytidylyltransferase [Solimonas aquatica]|uniref:2-C-methyl-D-erythritol 4-phosphate cytidylyltransferase n=1 Tax=Solimonas aquatica TaxID=489703 RepID=A0A1H9AIT6_9GAMM|nr:2-C-methyl-D-erythritol 4-phosphate cytidylyltransferase [Solimonas aquatica]SEP76391.1 2-C-methyl-D-erythritol 4-phosphate cytidylyltransferase [Solimonas aquatica]
MSGAAASTRYWAVIPAAGGGTRMNSGRPKQYLSLKDRALIEWSIQPFLDAEWIDGVVLVLARADSEFARLPIARHPRILTTLGGGARAESVLAGLEVVAERSAGFKDVQVLVHDAARPCLHGSDMERLCEEADDDHGGILALPVSDTLKRARQHKIAETVDRAFYWRAQTPQLFRLEPLIRALKECAEHGLPVTDEASAMERAGYQPRLVRGRESNIKVTYPEDLQLAGFWLAQAQRRP